MAFKKTTRQIVVEKRSVFIGSFQEARDIIADFNEIPSNRFNAKYGCKTEHEGVAITYAAASYIISFLADDLNHETCKELEVKLVPDSPAEPTWTSSDGTCTRVRDLPTPYLANIARKYSGVEAGIFADIREELRKRERQQRAA